jgi:GDP-mannose 6-dehydrogenase
MKVSVFGLGYVGAVTVGCLADLGHEVVGVDIVPEKVALVGEGRSPIAEPGLNELLARGVEVGRIEATTDPIAAVASTDVALVCVSTPSDAVGGVDTRHLEAVCRQIGEALSVSAKERFTVMVRSTSLPSVHRHLMTILAESSGRPIGVGLGYVCHPEFLREGAAVKDFYAPGKIVFGATDSESEIDCRRLYPGIEAQTYFVPVDVASVVKYADNAFHAVKVTFANEIGLLCKAMGVDSHSVMDVFRQDTKLNVSAKYLRPGNPFGGSCLPKDVRGILDAARTTATPMLLHAATLESNRIQLERLVKRIVDFNGRRPVGVVGLAFKEGTDDVRESPMVSVVEQLLGKGIPVDIYDPQISIESLVGRNRTFVLDAIPHLADLLASDLDDLVSGASTIVVHHALTRKIWQSVHIAPSTHVLDMVGVDALVDHPLYEGLYW